MKWERLSSHQPLDRRRLMAETEQDRGLVILFAQLEDPQPPAQPGLDPECYGQLCVPLPFGRTVSQNALAGMSAVAEAPANHPIVSAARRMLQELALEEFGVPNERPLSIA